MIDAALAGTPLPDRAASALAEAGFAVRPVASFSGDEALAVTHGDGAIELVASLRAARATYRLPVLHLGAGAEQRRQALRAGANALADPGGPAGSLQQAALDALAWRERVEELGATTATVLEIAEDGEYRRQVTETHAMLLSFDACPEAAAAGVVRALHELGDAVARFRERGLGDGTVRVLAALEDDRVLVRIIDDDTDVCQAGKAHRSVLALPHVNASYGGIGALVLDD